MNHPTAPLYEIEKPHHPQESVCNNPKFYQIFGKNDLLDAVKTITDDYAYCDSLRREKDRTKIIAER